jgi:uncharacterized protein YkwD
MLRRQLLMGASVAPLLPALPRTSFAHAVAEVAIERDADTCIPPAAKAEHSGPIEHHGEELRVPSAVRIERGGQIETLGDDVHGVLEDGIVLVSHTTARPTATELRNALKLINNQRIKRGLGPLALTAKLNCAAQRQANHMSTARRCGHIGSGGSNAAQRAEACGYKPWRSIGENVACGYSTWSSAMNAWMGSPGHRSNILSSRYRHVGLGRRNHYYVQVFGAQ